MTTTRTTTVLAGDDVVELGELLGFLHDWLSDRDVAMSLRHFTLGLIPAEEIRSDLARFAGVLGVDIAPTDISRRGDEGDDW